MISFMLNPVLAENVEVTTRLISEKNGVHNQRNNQRI
jgi:hypothetical protein